MTRLGSPWGVWPDNPSPHKLLDHTCAVELVYTWVRCGKIPSACWELLVHLEVQQQGDQLPSAAWWTKFQCLVPRSKAYNWLSQLACCSVRKTSRTGTMKDFAVTSVTWHRGLTQLPCSELILTHECVASVTNRQYYFSKGRLGSKFDTSNPQYLSKSKESNSHCVLSKFLVKKVEYIRKVNKIYD